MRECRKTQEYLRMWGLPQPFPVFLLLGMHCNRGMALSLPLPLLLQDLFRSWDVTKTIQEKCRNHNLPAFCRPTISFYTLTASGWLPLFWKAHGLGRCKPASKAVCPLSCSHQRTRTTLTHPDSSLNSFAELRNILTDLS